MTKLIPSQISGIISDDKIIVKDDNTTFREAQLSDFPTMPGQVQADWDETDPLEVSFIDNKPTIVTTIGTPWTDDNLVTEKAVRDAIVATGNPAIIAWATNTAHAWATNISWNSVNVVLDTIVSNITWTLTFGIGWWNSSKSFFIRKNWITVIWPTNGGVSWSTSVVPWDTIEFMYSSNFSDWGFNLTWSTSFNFDYTPFFS